MSYAFHRVWGVSYVVFLITFFTETAFDFIQQANPKAGEKTDKTGGKGQSVRWKAWWRQGNIKCAVSEKYASCWVHQDCHVADVHSKKQR